MMRTSARPLFVVGLLLLAACATSRDGAGGPLQRNRLAIVGVNVIAMTDPLGVSADQTVVIEGERIVAVGPRRSVRVPADAQIVEGAGQYVMPGLVDAHVHLEHFDTTDVLRLFLAHGVTTVRNMDGRPHVLAWRDQLRTGALVGPQIVTAGPILDGAPPLLPDNLSVPTREAARLAVAAQARSGYDFVKVYTNLSAEVYGEIADAARNAGLAVAGHVPRSVSAGTAAASQHSIEHLTDIGRWIEADDSPHAGKWHWSKLVVGAPIDPQKLEAVAKQLAAGGTYVVPTLTQSARSVASSEELRRWGEAAEVRPLPRTITDEWESRVRRASSRLEGEDWQIVARGVAQRHTIVRVLRGAGVRLLIGTDTPNPFVVPGASVHEELRHFLSSGASAGEALVAATRAPCEFLRLDCGVIAPARRADLLLLARNPLESLANLQPVTVIVGGRPYRPSELLASVWPQ